MTKNQAKADETDDFLRGPIGRIELREEINFVLNSMKRADELQEVLRFLRKYDRKQ